MKKFTLSLVMMLMTAMGISAEVITVWEGNSTTCNFFNGTDSYNALMGNGAGQANLSDGDVITIYYTGATEGNKLWIQNIGWDTYAQSITGASNDLLTAGDGTYEINVTEAFVEAIKADASANEGGIRLRRGGSPTYNFTKVTVTKGEKKTDNGGEATPTNITVIWEGTSSEGSLYFAPESAEYNKIFGDGKNQANIEPGDIVRFYYTGAENDAQIWVQANWDGVGIDASTPTLPNGDGSCEFTVTQAAIDMYKTNGIRFRRPSGSVYTLTKIEIEKVTADPSVLVPGADETILWEGNETGDYTLSFRYDPNKTNFVNAVSAGMFVNVYLSNVAEGDKIFAKECADWSYLNDGNTELTAGQQIYSFQLTQEMIDKIAAGGLVFQQHDSQVYNYTFRYVTVSAETKATAIKTVENKAQMNGIAYNIAGQRVAANAKGLVIINGKKFINK